MDINTGDLPLITKIHGNVEVLIERTKQQEAAVASMKKTIESQYVTRSEFEPIKRAVYGALTAIVLAFLAAVGKIVFGG